MTKGIEEILGEYRLAYGLPDPRSGAAEFCKAALLHPIPPNLTQEDADAVQDLLALLDPQEHPAEREREKAVIRRTMEVDVDVRGLDTALKKMERLKKLVEEYGDAMKRLNKVTRETEAAAIRMASAYKDTMAKSNGDRKRERKERAGR